MGFFGLPIVYLTHTGQIKPLSWSFVVSNFLCVVTA